MCQVEFITDIEIYEKVIRRTVPHAADFLWIATSDIKDLHVHKKNSMVPFLEVLSDLVGKGVSIRLLHAKEPGPAFRRDFDRYPALIDGIERIRCPRVHFKSVIVDGKFAYTGSANLTGAGMGAKTETRRNFEAGITTEDKTLVTQIMAQFDDIWMGSWCGDCKRKQYCAAYDELLADE